MKSLILLFAFSLVACSVTVYDPPMVENRIGIVCSQNSQCPFPALCQKDVNQAHGTCQ